jgi:hypothetical protein
MVILLSIEQITKGYRRVFGLDGDDDLMTVIRFHSSAIFQKHGGGSSNEDFDDDDFGIGEEDEEQK